MTIKTKGRDPNQNPTQKTTDSRNHTGRDDRHMGPAFQKLLMMPRQRCCCCREVIDGRSKRAAGVVMSEWDGFMMAFLACVPCMEVDSQLVLAKAEEITRQTSELMDAGGTKQ